MIALQLLDLDKGLSWAQRLVKEHHYRHAEVHPAGQPVAYRILVDRMPAGCLIFGRPEATRCGGFYGNLEDVARGWCPLSYWGVINLARVFIMPQFQQGGVYFGPEYLPFFSDRKGVMRPRLASTAIKMALDRVVVDYLIARPPCFLDEPYQLEVCISYCDTRLHSGNVYRGAKFKLARTNKGALETWRKGLRPLTKLEDAKVREASRLSPRSRRFRAAREVQQLGLGI